MTTLDPSAVPDYAGLMRLDGKGVVVLGAGQGIGRQVTHALAQAGAKTLCVDFNARCAEEIAAEVGGIACAADVTARDAMERVFVDARKNLNQPYAVVDVVGRAHVGPMETTDDEIYWRQHEIVFRHAWLAIQQGAPWLAEAGGGSIVLVGSLSGARTSPNQALYGSLKAAVHHLAESATLEYAQRGVRVNTVAPGPTRTPRLVQLLGAQWPDMEAAIPTRRAANPSDVAGAVLFLCTPLARQITGQTLLVDGGMSCTVMRHTPRSPFKTTAIDS